MNLDKAKRYAKKLWERVRYAADSPETEVARTLLEEIKVKYGWTNADFLGKDSSAKDANIRLEFVPNISYKSNPNWFKILIQLVSPHFECKAVAFYDRLGAALVGTEENTEKFLKELEFALERSKHTFKVVSAFTKDIKRADYFFGFAAGFNQALIQERIAKQQVQMSEEEKELTNKLVRISMALINVEKEVNEMKGQGKVKDEDLKQDIKDQNSFIIGFADGKLAKIKLIAKVA